MDTLAHGLVTYAVGQTVRKKVDWRWLVFFGIWPDLVWLPFTAYGLLSHGALVYYWGPYNVSHSLVVWGAVTLLATIRWRKTWLFTWPWALHLLIDIPGHLDMPTPILWPLSRWHIGGWFDWLAWPWLVGTYLLLGTMFGWYWWRNRKQANNSSSVSQT